MVVLKEKKNTPRGKKGVHIQQNIESDKEERKKRLDFTASVMHQRIIEFHTAKGNKVKSQAKMIIVQDETKFTGQKI